MVKRNLTKDPPRLYSAGQEVLVKLQSKKWNKVKGKGVSVPPCIITWQGGRCKTSN